MYIVPSVDGDLEPLHQNVSTFTESSDIFIADYANDIPDLIGDEVVPTTFPYSYKYVHYYPPTHVVCVLLLLRSYSMYAWYTRYVYNILTHTHK